MNKYYPSQAPGSIAGSGGGCFTKDQLVFTSIGWKPIYRIKTGDLVVGFDTQGRLAHGTVIETFKHAKVDNNSGIYTLYWKDENDEEQKIECTGNHSIYVGDVTETHFAEARELKVGDHLIHYSGSKLEIIKIDVREIDNDEYTYNLHVEPQHTYIVNSICVHNGGGGKKSSSRPAQEDPNTLRSTNIGRIMEVISEGPIYGLTTNSFKSIYFNDTVVQNPDDTYNFSVMQGDFRIGLPVQDYVTGFNGAESVVFVNTEVTSTTPVIRTLIASSDAALVQIRLPSGLLFQDSTTGDLKGNSVQIGIDARPTGGTWVEVMAPIISGKTTSPYDVAYRISKPSNATGTWDVRVRRITPDSEKANDVKETYFYLVNQIDEVKLSYPDVAYAALAIDAQSVGNTIPSRSYDVKGLICQVPSNYNPITRSYSGIWNGTFKYDWTDNPAWVVYDLLTSTRYGLGEYVDVSSIDKWSFYSAAQYNDQLVPDGSGGTEPRFTFNQPLSTREEAWKVIQSVASTMRAVVVPGGVITLVQDRPSYTVKIVTNANVKDGLFTYTSSGVLSRHTVCNVTFNDKNDRYLPRTVTEEFTEGINKYGYNLVDLAAWGAVTEGQARRAAKWLLDTENNQTEMVTYETSFNQADLLPGDVISVVDNEYVGATFAGRIVSISGSTVTFDSSVVLKPGAVYTLNFVDADGVSIGTRTVTSPAGTYTTVSLNSALPAGVEGREWMLSSPNDVAPRLFRVVTIKEVDKGEFSVSALFYDPNKYDRIETGVVNPDLVYSAVLADVVNPVTNITGTVESFIDPVKGPQVNLRVRWDKPSTPYTDYYLLKYTRDQTPFSQTYSVDNNEFIIENVTEGDYLFQVITVNMRGVQSPPAVANVPAFYSGVLTTLLPPINLRTATGQGSGNHWYSENLYLVWEPNPLNEFVQGEVVGGYKVRIYDETETNIIREQIVGPDVNSFTYYYDDNKGDGGLRRNLLVKVYTLNALLQPSSPDEVLFIKPAPPVPDSFSISVESYTQYTVNISIASPTPDTEGVIVFQGNTEDFIPTTANIVYQGPNRVDGITVTVQPALYYVRVAAYDAFGLTGINVSDAEPTVDPTIPVVIDSLRVVGGVDGNAFLSWSPSRDPTHKYQILHNDVNDSSSAALLATVTGTTYLTPALNLEEPNYFWVRVINTLGQVGVINTGLTGAEFKRLKFNLFVNSAQDPVNAKIDVLQYRVWYTVGVTSYLYPSSNYASFSSSKTTFRPGGDDYWSDEQAARLQDSVYSEVINSTYSHDLQLGLDPAPYYQPGWIELPDIPDNASITGIELSLRGQSTKFGAASEHIFVELIDPETNKTSEWNAFPSFTAANTWQVKTLGNSTELFGMEGGGVMLPAIASKYTPAVFKDASSISQSTIYKTGTTDPAFYEDYGRFSITSTNTWELFLQSLEFTAEDVSTYKFNINIGSNVTGISTAMGHIGLKYKVSIFDVTANTIVDEDTQVSLEGYTAGGPTYGSASNWINFRSAWSAISLGGDGVLIPGHRYKINIYAYRMIVGPGTTATVNAWVKMNQFHRMTYNY